MFAWLNRLFSRSPTRKPRPRISNGYLAGNAPETTIVWLRYFSALKFMSEKCFELCKTDDEYAYKWLVKELNGAPYNEDDLRHFREALPSFADMNHYPIAKVIVDLVERAVRKELR